MANRTDQELARRGTSADAAAGRVSGTPEDAHAVFGAHRCRKGKCAAGCPGPWPCSVAIAIVSGDSTPPRPKGAGE